MTVKNPGSHGIFGFAEINRNYYEPTFSNFDSLKKRAAWGSRKSRSVAFTIPQTYPARPINSVLVSGFLAIALKQSVIPHRVFEYPEAIKYRLNVDAGLAKTDPDACF